MLLALKGVLAAALLAWIVSEVHWDDYVVAGGEPYTVLQADPSRAEPRRLLL